MLFFLLVATFAMLYLEQVFYVHSPRARLITPNSIVDYLFCAFNLAVVGVVAGLLLSQLNVAFQQYLPWLDLRLLDRVDPVAQGVITFLVIDFVSYVSHWVRHRVEWLWLFHSTHHSQEVMNPLTNLRSHPVDQIVHRTFFVLPFFILGGPAEYWFWFGVIDALWGYFVHADVKINFGPLKYVLVTPQYHRIHHSLERKHWNQNFADRLVIWDYLFGTRYPGTDEYPDTGIEGYPVRETSYHPWHIVHNLAGHFLYPFQVIYRSLRKENEPGSTQLASVELNAASASEAIAPDGVEKPAFEASLVEAINHPVAIETPTS